MNRRRSAVAALVLSAAGMVSIFQDEMFVGTAMVPTKNDRPTVGFGSTFREDGSPVQLGDTIGPVQAIKRSMAHINKDETRLKQCVTGEMNQVEYDILVDFSYQYGTYRTCSSSMVRHTNSGNYVAACNAYPAFKFSGGYDCSTLIKDKYGKLQPNRRCWGVWTRNLERRDKCLAAQS
jgi:GH24 family phage-related lysozyme (muramidase)